MEVLALLHFPKEFIAIVQAAMVSGSPMSVA
jgi:hypothetical protein